ERLLEADLHVVAQVGAALAAAAAPAPGAAAHAEQVVEDVGEGRGDVAEAAGCAGAAVLEGGVAEAVVGSALVGVLEDLVGLVDLLEAGLARLVTGIAVRVPLHGELAERGLELGVGGGALDFQDLVVAALGHPRVSPHRGGVVDPYMVIHGASKRLLERIWRDWGTPATQTRCAPRPLWGRAGEGGSCCCTRCVNNRHPHP